MRRHGRNCSFPRLSAKITKSQTTQTRRTDDQQLESLWPQANKNTNLNHPNMALEIKINDRTTTVEQISADGSKYIIRVGKKNYEIDALMVEQGAYSLLYEDKSFNVEVIEGEHNKNFQVNTLYSSYNVDIIDAERKYLMSRKSGDDDDEAQIKVPMPGKVVRVPVKVGDNIKAGDTIAVVSAMKMESEYKVKQDRTVKEVHVKDGDIVKAGQILVVVE